MTASHVSRAFGRTLALGLEFSGRSLVLNCTAAKSMHDVGPGFQNRDPQTE